MHRSFGRGRGSSGWYSRLFGRHAEDVAGLAFIVVAGLAALGIYSDLAGPAGRVLDRGTGDLVGWARVLVPPALALVGWMLLRGGREPERAPARAAAVDERVSGPWVRVAVGASILVVAVAGIAEEVQGPDHWQGSLARLRSAGGLLGAGIGVPLRSGLGSWGAGLVLAAAVVVSLLVLTATPARQAAALVASAGASNGRLLRTSCCWLAGLPERGRRRGAASRHPSAPGRPRLFDAEADDGGGGQAQGGEAGDESDRVPTADGTGAGGPARLPTTGLRPARPRSRSGCRPPIRPSTLSNYPSRWARPPKPVRGDSHR